MFDLFEELRGRIADLSTLLSLVTSLLDNLGLLPPQYRRYNTRPSTDTEIKKHVAQIQRILLTQILPTWDTLLAENNAILLIEQFFCPDGFMNALPTAGYIAIVAYSTLASTSSEVMVSSFTLRILERLSKEYPIDRMHGAVYTRTDTDQVEKDALWEDVVRNVCMVPTKVANAVGSSEKGIHPPDALGSAIYFNNLSRRLEVLISAMPTPRSSITYLLGKLVNIGVFPAHPPIAQSSQPSFFQSTLPIIRTRSNSAYFIYWSSLFVGLPSSLTLQSILVSLFASLRDAPTDNERSYVRQEAALLSKLVGPLHPDAQELWEICNAVITNKSWPETHARIFVCWASGGAPKNATLNFEVLGAFMGVVLDTWSSTAHIKHSLLTHHRYLTTLLLVSLSYFPKSLSYVKELAHTPAFINAISVYISHIDPSIRLIGMFAAEVVAHRSNKELDFKTWDGDDQGKPWCRTLRLLLDARDVDAPLEEERPSVDEKSVTMEEDITTPPSQKSPKATNKEPSTRITYNTVAGYDSDDSITGYASPPSSRSASPTFSELEDIERDPTLGVSARKVSRPVYLAQLGDLVRGGSSKVGPDDPHEADRIEMALNTAEELIRKKQGFGTELEENAVNLVFAFLALQDNFDLYGFSEKRQGALNALVACAPRKAMPTLIQEFFKNQYSADQRFVALNAIAIGARELASLPVPPSLVSVDRTAFPSKTLPGPLHRKYMTTGKANTDLVPLMVDELSKKTLEPESEAASTSNAPELMRERRLRIQRATQPQRVAEISQESLNPFSSFQPPITKSNKTRFIDVAAEYFILPLISSFWSFLRDEQAREERTSQLKGRAQYRGAGTGLILNPMILAQFVRTLAILVNASQNAPEWLATIAPDALELSITIGTRPISYMETEDDEDKNDEQFKEASLLTSTLELALVILGGVLEIDGGRILGLEHTTLVLGVEEWAGKIFSGLEKGIKVRGGGGAQEVKLSRAAAGVLLQGR